MCTVHRKSQKLTAKEIELQQYLSAGELHGNLLRGIDNKTAKNWKKNHRLSVFF